METQNQIKRTLTRPETIQYVHDILESSDEFNRAQLVEHLCEKFNFIDPGGKKQRTGCLTAIRELELKGHFVLPASNRSPFANKPKRLDHPVPAPINVPDKAGKIDSLKLVLVESEEHSRIWNELLFTEHPRGSAIFVGRQIRYLVDSEHGWLGAAGFSSAALQLADREKWIGWNSDDKRKHLDRIVNMSRFLVRPGMNCKNLASRLLGMLIRQFPGDFESRYNLRPLLLESFIDTELHSGTCYKASNWQWVGKTKGRSRQGKTLEQIETIKDIYLYPLVKNFRSELGLSELTDIQTPDLEPLEMTSGLDSCHWAENEFGGAQLGDKRSTARLIESAKVLAEKPGQSYGPAVNGDWKSTKAYYRMIDKPDDSAMTMENMLSPHKDRTIQRMKNHELVLCPQDGTDLNYNSISVCKGLGIIGKNQTGAKTRGLHLHSTLAMTSEGLPLGIIRADCTAPKIKEPKASRKNPSEIAIEEKKSFCWLQSVRECEQIKKQIPETTIVNIMDREGDIFEMFDDQRLSCKNVELLVRAKHDRRTTEDVKLFESVKNTPSLSTLKIKVPRQSARPKKSKQKARSARPQRTAEVSVHHRHVKMAPPKTKMNKGKAPIGIWIVCVSEISPPEDQKPIEWFLLTTVAIKFEDDAKECIRWYCLRWRIEDWHRVMKSGCNIEKKAHKTAERLKRSLAINMVIAWRIMLMTLLGRETPELPAEVLFTDLELEVMQALSEKKTLPHL